MPYPDHLFEAGRALASEALFLSRDLLPSMAPIPRFPEWTADQRRAIGYLLSATARATESTFLLCAYGQLWDAEILARTVAEGSLKLCYLLQDRDKFHVRCEEYQVTLFNLACVRDQERMQSVLEASSNPADPVLSPLGKRMFGETEIEHIRGAISKTKQRDLETRWSFTGIMRHLLSSKDSLFKNVFALSHTYAMASHLVHSDYTGASMPLDRDMRSPDRRDMVHMAHEARIASDVLNFLLLRMATGYRFVQCDRTPLARAKEAVDSFVAKYESLARQWVGAEYGV